jgi:hypothetical protein
VVVGALRCREDLLPIVLDLLGDEQEAAVRNALLQASLRPLLPLLLPPLPTHPQPGRATSAAVGGAGVRAGAEEVEDDGAARALAGRLDAVHVALQAAGHRAWRQELALVEGLGAAAGRLPHTALQAAVQGLMRSLAGSSPPVARAAGDSLCRLLRACRHAGVRADAMGRLCRELARAPGYRKRQVSGAGRPMGKEG